MDSWCSCAGPCGGDIPLRLLKGRQIDRQIDREIDIRIDKQMDKYMDRQMKIWMNRQMDRYMDSLRVVHKKTKKMFTLTVKKCC